MIIRDQFQSLGIDGVNLSVCFSAMREYFSAIHSFAEPAVRFYNKCFLAEYTRAAFGSTQVNILMMSEWLYEKTLGHPDFLAFICRDFWSQYHAPPFTDPAHLWQGVFNRLERGKFTTDLAQFSNKEIALYARLPQARRTNSIPLPSPNNFIRNTSGD